MKAPESLEAAVGSAYDRDRLFEYLGRRAVEIDGKKYEHPLAMIRELFELTDDSPEARIISDVFTGCRQ